MRSLLVNLVNHLRIKKRGVLMGQAFFQSVYEDSSNKYRNFHPFCFKLGELAYNGSPIWEMIKNRKLRVATIGDENDRYCQGSYDEERETYDYGVAAKDLRFESDCDGELELSSKEDEVKFNWEGYLINYSQNIYFDIKAYYKRSKIGHACIDPLVVLTASNRAATLFFHAFSNDTAYSLLGSWCYDTLEWTEDRPEQMNELINLEFGELFWKSQLELFGTTEDGYLADRNKKTYYTRQNLNPFYTRISPAKVKYKITYEGESIRMNSEFEPDEGVFLANQSENTVTFKDADGNDFTDLLTTWYGAAKLTMPSGEIINLE